MYKNKNVLLIAGGGTLGTYTAEELLSLGAFVDILCPEDKVSNHPNLKFIKGVGSEEFLKEIVTSKHYDGIVNFIHYTNVDAYKPIHKLLCKNTEHLIFLSSYRVYADKQIPITEDAPMLLYTSKDEYFLANETYALAKARAEYFIKNESNTSNWTIVRPVISFSEKRFDIVTISRRIIIEKAKANEILYLPHKSKNLTAGLDWAGNSGKLIANLLFKKQAFGESYTISSAPNLTWGEVADIYTKLLGVRIEWIDDQLFTEKYNKMDIWGLIYDRFYDRKIDNSKVLNATGLVKTDFLSIEEGIKIELKKLSQQ